MTQRDDAPQSLHELILQATARGWCSPKNSGKVMDSDLANAIAAEVEKAVDEHYALKFAAIMTACIQNTPESAKDRIQRGHPYWTVAYGDVCTAVDREMALLAQRSEIAPPPDRHLSTHTILDDASNLLSSHGDSKTAEMIVRSKRLIPNLPVSPRLTKTRSAPAPNGNEAQAKHDAWAADPFNDWKKEEFYEAAEKFFSDRADERKGE